MDTVTIHIIGTNEIINHKEYKDIVPYLACLVGAMGSSQKSTDMWITARPSYLNDNDDYYDRMLTKFKSKMRYAKSKTKKNGEEFDQDAFVDKFIREWCWMSNANEAYEVIQRYLNKEPVKPYPLNGICKYYLKNLKDEMEKYGLNFEEWLEKWEVSLDDCGKS